MSSARRQSTAPRSVDEARIRAFPRQMIDAWNGASGAAFAAPFSDRADFIAFEGTHLEGRDEITTFHQRIFDTVAKGSRLSGASKFVRFLRPDMAVMHSVVSVTLPGAAAPTPSRESMQLFVVAHANGEWRAEALLNARRLTLEQQDLADDFEALPPESQGEVRELIATLKARHSRRA